MRTIIFGGGDIALKGILPVLDGKVFVLQKRHCDVRYYDEVDKIISIYQPDLVINCAGISHPVEIAKSNISNWEDEISVNLIGSYYIARAALKHDINDMIFIASVAGMYGKPNHSGYSASKGGVISLVQSLGMEGVNAYAISPGRVNTKMREKDYPNEDVRTRLDPKQIGEVVLDILNKRHQPGDNLVIRKIGYETFHRTDKGEPWREYLRVGEPPAL